MMTKIRKDLSHHHDECCDLSFNNEAFYPSVGRKKEDIDDSLHSYFNSAYLPT